MLFVLFAAIYFASFGSAASLQRRTVPGYGSIETDPLHPFEIPTDAAPSHQQQDAVIAQQPNVLPLVSPRTPLSSQHFHIDTPRSTIDCVSTGKTIRCRSTPASSTRRSITLSLLGPAASTSSRVGSTKVNRTETETEARIAWDHRCASNKQVDVDQTKSHYTHRTGAARSTTSSRRSRADHQHGLNDGTRPGPAPRRQGRRKEEGDDDEDDEGTTMAQRDMADRSIGFECDEEDDHPGRSCCVILKYNNDIMGNGKKNKIGGQPKQKGRLASALVNSQWNASLRAKARIAADAKEERAKAATAGATQSQLKKQRKAERALEKGKERAAEEAAALVGTEKPDGDALADGALPGKGKRAREERDRRRGTIPYGLGEKILLVGEGNFSFAHSLLLNDPPLITPHLLLATSFDTQAAAMEKYPDLMLHVDAIKEKGGKVVFGVDATDLKKCREVKDAGSWDRVAFNFPHVGAGISDQDRNVRANQTLILRFFRSIAPFLRQGLSSSTVPTIVKKPKQQGASIPSKNKKTKRPTRHVNSDDEADAWDDHKSSRSKGASGLDDDDNDDPEEEDGDGDSNNIALLIAPLPPKTAGTVLITLRTGAPYSLWTVAHLGTRGALIAPSILPRPHPSTPQPTYRVVRSFNFAPADYEGYEHRRTIGFREGVSSAANDDLTMSARERGEKRREEKEDKERDEKKARGAEERKGTMRTYEFELCAAKDEDDLYD